LLWLLTSYLICPGNDSSRVPWWSKQSQDILPYRIFIWLCGSIFIALPVCSNGPGFLFWSVGLMVPKRIFNYAWSIHRFDIVMYTYKSISNFFIVSGTHWDYHENFISCYRKTWLNDLNGRTSWSSTFNGLETKNKICWEQKQGFQDVNMIPSFGNW